ncbi:MAG: 30S ribosome-binding factor RbfA [Lentisphaerae bacterium]|nr:30S ribosome-binding factor RbfA [Lentisphaerota bacterium]
MKANRLTRINELLRREIGDLLFRIMNDSRFDLSAVTVTRVVTSRDLRSARVFVSIRDHDAERDAMLNKLRKHRGEIQNRINTDLVLKYTPRLDFELDTSIEEGDRVLTLLAQLPPADPETTDDSGNPTP